jgi:hypothetical protein
MDRNSQVKGQLLSMKLCHNCNIKYFMEVAIMKKDSCELVFILDKSGSMSGLESDTIGGFNANLKAHRELGGDVRVTTALFNDKYELLHDRIDINAVAPMNEKEYQAGGMTALLDAVGETINKLRKVYKQQLRISVPRRSFSLSLRTGRRTRAANTDMTISRN